MAEVGLRSRSNLLLELKLPESGERIVPSIADLAEHVFAEGTGYREPRTMSPLLSDALRGKRPISKELKQAILGYVATRVPAKSKSRSEILARYETGIIEEITEEEALEFSCARPDIASLSRAIKNAREIVAVLPANVFSNEAGRTLLEMFARRVGLLSGSEDNLIVTLWFKDELSAQKWWYFLHDFLSSFAGQSEAAATNSILTVESAGRVRTEIVNKLMTAYKVIVTDPSDMAKAEGFVFNITKGVGVAFFQGLGSDGTKDWIENVYAEPRAERVVEANSIFKIEAAPND